MLIARHLNVLFCISPDGAFVNRLADILLLYFTTIQYIFHSALFCQYWRVVDYGGTGTQCSSIADLFS